MADTCWPHERRGRWFPPRRARFLAGRWVFTIIPTSGTLPSIYIGVSQTNSATGKWWIYRGFFGGGLFPSGTLIRSSVIFGWWQ